MFTHEQREKKFEKASELQRQLYDGAESGRAIGTLAEKHKITQHVDFAIAVGDVILDLVPKKQLPSLMVERLGVSQADAMRISADVLDFLAPLSAPQPVAAAPGGETAPTPATSDSVVMPPTTPAPPPGPAVNPPAPRQPVAGPASHQNIADMIDAIENDAPAAPAASVQAAAADQVPQADFTPPAPVEPMRTMAHDMEVARHEQVPAQTPITASTTPTPPAAPAAQPPTASVQAAATDQVPDIDMQPLYQPVGQDNLLTHSPGNRAKNPNATWGEQ